MRKVAVKWVFFAFMVIFIAPRVFCLDIKIAEGDGILGQLGKGDFGLGKVIEGIKSIGPWKKGNGTSCIMLLGKMAVNGLPGMFSCLVDMQLASKKLKVFNPCLGKCIGQKTKIFTEEGLPNLSYIAQLLDQLPKPMQEIAEEIVDSCSEKALDLDPNDRTCESYAQLLKCTSTEAQKRSDKLLSSCSEIPDAYKEVTAWVSRTIGGVTQKLN